MSAASRIPWWAGALGALVSYVVGQVAGAVGAVIGIVVLVAVLHHAFDPQSLLRMMLEPYVFIPMLGLTGVVQGLLPAGVTLLARRNPIDALGLRRAPLVPTLLAPFGMLALGPLSDLATSLMARAFPSWTLGSLDELADLGRAGPLWLMVWLMAVLPGMSEELVFRGLLQRSIRRRRLGMAVSAVFFALAHVDPHHVAGVLPLGFYLAWVAMRSDSIWPTILAHIANNAVAVALSRVDSLNAGAHEDSPLPWWVTLIGVAVAIPIIAAIARATRPAPPPTLTVGPA